MLFDHFVETFYSIRVFTLRFERPGVPEHRHGTDGPGVGIFHVIENITRLPVIALAEKVLPSLELELIGNRLRLRPRSFERCSGFLRLFEIPRAIPCNNDT